MADILTNPYTIMGCTGIIAAGILIYILVRKFPQLAAGMAGCAVCAVIGMFIGAHLLYFIVGLPDFAGNYSNDIYDVQSFLTAFLNASAGMVFYGGLFDAILSILICCKASNLNSRLYLNALCCAFPMVHAFGRIGCALGGCCYGIEYHGPFAIQYTEAQINPGVSDHIADFPRFPVQVLEAVLELALCALLFKLFLKFKDQYALTPLYLLIYGIIRFFDEFLRGDTIRGIWGPFSTSQWISIACIIGAVIYFCIRRKVLHQHSETM